MTSVVIRFRGGRELAKLQGWVELQRAQYRRVAEVVADHLHDVLCDRRAGQALEGGGRLAWLPNHEYEVTLEVRLVVGYAPTGAQDATVIQPRPTSPRRDCRGSTRSSAWVTSSSRTSSLATGEICRAGCTAASRSRSVRRAVQRAGASGSACCPPPHRPNGTSCSSGRSSLNESRAAAKRGGCRSRAPTWVVIHRGTGGPIRWRPVVSRTGEGHMRSVTRTALTLTRFACGCGDDGLAGRLP